MTLVAVHLFAAGAFGHPFRGMDHSMGPWGGGPMSLPLLLKGVGLTDAQQAQVKQIVSAHRPQFRALMSQVRAAHQQLTEKLYSPGAVSAEDLAPLRQQISQLRDQIGQEALQVALEIRAILTPEQLAKAAQIRQRASELTSELRSLYRGQP
jgi:Spy/CpxP family protein refolding chaperone